jgi:hypothetical protein
MTPVGRNQLFIDGLFTRSSQTNKNYNTGLFSKTRIGSKSVNTHTSRVGQTIVLRVNGETQFHYLYQ